MNALGTVQCVSSESSPNSICLLLVGESITVESPYRATLTSIFPDGTKRQRHNVEGVLQRKYLNKISPEYSRVYKIKDSVVITKGESGGGGGGSRSQRENNDKRSSYARGSKVQGDNHYNNHISETDWDNTHSRGKPIEMLSDQIKQKTSTRKTENKQELPLISGTIQNSAQKNNLVSATSKIMYFLTFFSTVLSVWFCDGVSIGFYLT